MKVVFASVLAGAFLVNAYGADEASPASAATPVATPVTLLGSSTIQPSVDTNPSGMAEAFIFTALSTGTAVSLNLYLDAGSTATRVIAGVYADAGGKPGALIASTALDKPKSGAWNAFSLPATTITSGARYWIAVLTPPGYGAIKFRDVASGGGGTVVTKQSDLKSLPASWVVGTTYANSPVSAYLTTDADSPNAPPTVTLSAPSSATIGTPVTLSATAADSDGTVAKVEFYDGATLIGTDTSAPYNLAWTFSTVGSHSMTAKATDNKGAATTSTAVSVSASATNVAPTVALSAPSSATVGTPVTLTATAADSDGTVAKVEFYDGATLIGTDTSAPYSLAWTFNSGGSHSMTAKATDNKGAATTSTAVGVSVTGTANMPPTVAWMVVPSTAQVGVQTYLKATANDADGNVAKVEFYDGATLIGTDTIAPYRIAWTFSTGGSHIMTARATDNKGAATTSAAVSVSVTGGANVPPTVALSAPSSATVGTPVTLSATAADSDGTVAKVEFYDGATLIGADTSAPYNLDWTFSTAGSHSMTAKATDNKGAATTSTAVSVSVSATNVAPTVALSAPSSATVGAPVTLSAAAADSDGTIAKVEFYDGATLIGTDTSTPYSLAWTFNSGGSHSMTAKATDNKGAATTSAAVSVSVSASNVAPTVSLSAPAKAIVGTAVTLSATATDSDGTIAKVEFYDGAALIGTDTSAPYSLAWTFLSAGTHSVTAKATDNKGGTTTSAPVPVTVSPPAPGPTTLSWGAPNSGVATAYRIYYGTSPRSYAQAFGSGIDAGAVTTYTLTGLTSGLTYYFAVTAVDAAGFESAYSDEVTKIIP